MNLNMYQQQAAVTAKYPSEMGLVYTVLGLCSEAGEVAGKVKKAIRDEGCVISAERRKEMMSELGDILWYVAMLATELDATLEDVAAMNIAKLSDRDTRGVIGGDGDER